HGTGEPLGRGIERADGYRSDGVQQQAKRAAGGVPAAFPGGNERSGWQRGCGCAPEGGYRFFGAVGFVEEDERSEYDGDARSAGEAEQRRRRAVPGAAGKYLKLLDGGNRGDPGSSIARRDC